MRSCVVLGACSAWRDWDAARRQPIELVARSFFVSQATLCVGAAVYTRTEVRTGKKNYVQFGVFLLLVR